MSTLPLSRLTRLWPALLLVVATSLAANSLPAAATQGTTAQGTTTTPTCTVVINEFMSAKQRVLADEDDDYSDWIELYNCTDQPIDLTGWHLSDRYDDPEQWTFPQVSLPAKDYMVLWASGKGESGKPYSADKGVTDKHTGLHTNFSIAADGEPLILTDANGKTVQDIAPLVLGKHEVAGRQPDGTGEFAILKEPTPGQTNTAAVAPAWVDAPEFSKASGFYDKPFKLALTHPDKDVTLYYTLDGSEPDPDNLEGSTYRYKNEYQQPPKKEGEKVIIKDNFLYNEYITQKYTKAISIKDRTWEPDRISQISTTFDEKPDYFPQPEVADHWQNTLAIQTNRVIKEGNRFIRRLNHLANRAVRKYHYWRTDEVRPIGDKQYIASIPEITWRKYKHLFKGTPVRAIAVKDSDGRRTTSTIATHTYFIGDRDQFSLPIIAMTVPEKDLFDYDEGIFVAGKLFEEWVASLDKPDKANCHKPTNYRHGRQDREKIAASATFFQDSDNSTIDIEIRGHGKCSTVSRVKSIRLYLDVFQGNKNINNISIFDKQQLALSRINLRNAGNQSSTDYIRDATIHEIVKGLSIGTQRYSPKVVFINGEYNGILNARERKDSRYIENNFDIKRSYVNLLKRRFTEDAGSADQYKSLLKDIKENDPAETDFYDLIKANIDISSFIDYFNISLFFARKDWPGNNIAFWQYFAEEDEGNELTDGLWRWLLYDADASYDDKKTNMLEFATMEGGKKWPNPDWSTFLLRRLLESPDLKTEFITRFNDLINSTLAPSRVTTIINNIENQISTEMPNHIARWQQPPSIKKWHEHIERMKAFARERPAIQRQHLQEFFDLDGLYTLHVDVNDKAMGTVKVNTLHLGLTDDELEKPVAASERATHMTDVLALPWQGEYYQNMPLKLEAIPNPGYQFSHWESHGKHLTTAEHHRSSLVLRPNSNLHVKAVYISAD